MSTWEPNIQIEELLIPTTVDFIALPGIIEDSKLSTTQGEDSKERETEDDN